MTRPSNASESSAYAGLAFAKMAGGGNDFLLIDDREGKIADPGALAFAACTRRLSVGADGLILVRPSGEATFRMVYHNADGSLADFCANGTRCAARFARLRGIAPETMTIETGHAVLEARMSGERVTLFIPAPSSFERERTLTLNDGSTVKGAYLMLGVPHYVIFEEGELWGLDIDGVGREIRHHAGLRPQGANVNFVRPRGGRRLEVRTWERGVEGETLSCGSGVVSSAATAALLGLVESPVEVLTRSGIVLTVEVSAAGGRIDGLHLTGDARVVYEGTLTAESVAGFDPEWVRNPTSEGAGS